MTVETADARQQLRAAVEGRDHARVVPLLAPDVVLKSPIIATPFEGREAVSNVMAAVIETFEDLHYTVDGETNGVEILAFRARVRGRDIEAVDLIRVNDEGLISEIVVHIRPLVGLAAVASALGPHVGRSRVGTLLLRALAAPLPILLSLVEPVVRRFARLRSS